MAIDFAEILTYTLGDNSVQAYLIALGVFILSIAVLRIFKYVVIRQLKRLSKKTKTDIDDILVQVVDDIHWPFYVLLSLYIAIHFIKLPNIVDLVIDDAIFLFAVYYIARGVNSLIKHTIESVIEKRKKEDKKVDPTVMQLLGKLLKTTLWIIVVLFVLSHFGYKISTLAAGLGIGGIAIAFALQNVLADIFASFSIYLDKPFKIGDFIVIGADNGTVEKIGIKSTRIKTLQGQELVVSNRELTETRVNNYGKMQKRRIVFTFGVTYQTPTSKMKKIPSIVKGIFDKNKMADLDRVHFKQFGDFSLNYEVVYFVKTSEYNVYMDVQQQINLALKESFEKEKIEFAYPTQTVFVAK